MPVYQVGEREYELPDGLSQEDTGYALQQLYLRDNTDDQPQTTQTATQTVTPQNPQTFPSPKASIDPDTLALDTDWLMATRTVHKMNEGQDWQGSDAELAEYGLDYMGWFNYNLPKMAYEANQLRAAPQEQKEAFLYLMDSYDNLDMSWGGVGRFFKGVASDPTTYVGLASLGIGTAAAQGTKTATKQGLKALLKQGMRTGIIAGVEGSIYAGTDNLIRQNIEVDAGRKDEVDNLELAAVTTVGGLAGFAGGTVLDAASNKVQSLFRGKSNAASEAVDEAGGETLTAIAERMKESQPETGSDVAARTSAAQADEAGSEVSGEVLSNVSLDDLNVPELQTPIPFESVSLEDQTAIARNIADELKELDTVQVESVMDDLINHKFTVKEANRFKTATLQARDEVAREAYELAERIKAAPNRDQQAELFGEFETVYARMGSLMKMDEALSSDSGQVLGRRKGRLDLKSVDLDDPESFIRLMEQTEQKVEVDAVRREYAEKIQTAEDDGDWAEAARLKVMRGLETEDELTKILTDPNKGLPESKIKRGLMKFNEMAISNVFSATTVLINLVPSGIKTVVRPAMDAFLSDPLEEATRRQMVATYSAMGSSVRSAAKAAVAAFKYEQSVLTRESGRLMEGELAIGGNKVSGKIAGSIRFLPRILNASDEFLGQISYQGFIASESAAYAFKEGTRKGLTGRRLDSFIRQHIEAELKNAYGGLDSEEALRTVINKGRNLGYKGERLAQYVKTEVGKSGEALRHGKDEVALNHVRDLLYKRAFSGKGAASSMAKRYEQFVAEQPWMRVVGQLFFRTPVRVFEEGIRLTPGVQILAPNFMADLAGKNGKRAQVKARGEALTSFAISGMIMQEYAKGNITGDGAYDHWKQQRARTDSDLPEPYTLKDEDGNTWSYRNFDPFATPAKIIVNALERFDDLATREKQGEFIAKKEKDKALAAVTVGTMAIATSIRDANLMAGVAEGLKLMEYVANPEDNERGGLKFVASKLRMLVPNTLHKIAKTNDPTLDDPATFWQMVESQVLFGGSGGTVQKQGSKSYDVLGNVRQLNDTGALWNIFSDSTPEERGKGRSEAQLRVLRGLDRLSKQTGMTFAMPNKHRLLPGADLRERMTGDGDETLYDRWVRYYREFPVTEQLDAVIGAGMPVGTKSINASTVTLVNQILSKSRDAAFSRLLAEEAQVMQGFIDGKIREAEVKSGFWDQ
ncbi:hypothetical protein [Endozoicomonas ascidiicola]|uniref:hypothetical protein n=1 Tax=Endozoicomonas ascidiicola TaxID=1698521 RepID=UPI0008305975|nr:hypothetical protein [Endozoicomonas ascidiicola]